MLSLSKHENPLYSACMLSPRWIFLDFDGVIMDSMTLKLDAYCFALAEYGFSREEVRRAQLMYAGLSRSRALPLMIEALGGEPLAEEAQARVLRRFAEEDIRLRPRMELLPGVRDFLEEAATRSVPLAVVTGTPQGVIDGTMDHFDIRRYFREVHGYPPAKPAHLQGLLDRHGLRPDEAVYVGDAILDYRAAEETKIPFIGIDRGDDPFRGLTLTAYLKGLPEMGDLLGWKAK
ncbi:MAG: Haloacid dehalogenase domain protein hydrolase [Fibrobacteria bacterium]|nr:Haloacid dehalogenase domain protein hydrolase [Fibrobacteria bacterium]